MEEIKKIIQKSQNYAKEQGINLNPDSKIVERIAKGLLENQRKYGFFYCPCRRVSGDFEKDQKNICPCYWHKEEIEKFGHCLCGLFVK